jgi:hypothetical protein
MSIFDKVIFLRMMRCSMLWILPLIFFFSYIKLLGLFPSVLQLSNNTEGGCLVNSIPSKDGRVDWSQVNSGGDYLIHKSLMIFQMSNTLESL